MSRFLIRPLDSALGEDRIVTVDMEHLMPIGPFAAASRLSQKALRLYGENGVLPPAWVDPDSGTATTGSSSCTPRR
jgi:hypothetical protein